MAFKNFLPSKNTLTINVIALDQFILVSIILISWICFFIPNYSFSPLWLFFNIICTALLALHLKYSSDTVEIKRVSLLSIIISVIFVIAFAVHRYFYIDQHLFWLDEYTQIKFSSTIGDLVHLSANEQQPFLSYLLTSIVHSLRPDSISFHRLVGFLPTVAALLIFFNRIKSENLLYAMALIPVFVFNWDWLYHSYEIRGIGCGLLGAAIWFRSLERFIQTDTKWTNIPILILSSFIFLNMVGVQPPLILFTATLTLIPLLLVNRSRKAALSIITSHTIAVILFLPSQLHTIEVARSLSKFKPDLWSSFNNYISHYDINSNFQNFSLYVDRNLNFYMGSILVLTIVFAITALFRARKYILTCLLLSLLVFPLIYDLAFNTIIQWQLMRHYWDVWRMLFILIPLFIIAKINYKKTTIVIALILSALTLQQPLTTTEVIKYYTKYRYDWSNLYSELDKKIQNETDVFFMGACNLDIKQWCPNFFIGPEFFLHVEKRKSLRSFHSIQCPKDIYDCSGIMEYLESDTGESKNGNIVIVFNYKFHVIDPSERALYQLNMKSKNIHYSSNSDFLIIESTSDNNEDALVNALEDACYVLPTSVQIFRICEYAARSLIHIKNKERAEILLTRLKDILINASSWEKDTPMNASYKIIKNKLETL